MSVAISVIGSNTFGGGSGSGTPNQQTLTIPSGAYVVVQLNQLSNASPTFVTPTIGGNAMTSLGADYTDSITTYKAHLYGLLVASGGSLVVAGGLSENFYQSRVTAVVLTGTTSSPISDVTGYSTTASVSRTIVSATGDLAMVIIEGAGTAGTMTPGTGVTNESITGVAGAFVLDKAGASSVVVDGNVSSAMTGFGFAFSVAAAGGGGGGVLAAIANFYSQQRAS